MKFREKLGYLALGGALMLIGVLAARFLWVGAHDEEVLFAVIGGVAVLIVVAGSFALPGAEDEPLDVNAGKIKCRELEVVGEPGASWNLTEGAVTCRAVNVVNKAGGVYLQATSAGGNVMVYGEGGSVRVDSGWPPGVRVYKSERLSAVLRRDLETVEFLDNNPGFKSELGPDVAMTTNEHGGIVILDGEGESNAGIGISKDGGHVYVRGKDAKFNLLKPE